MLRVNDPTDLPKLYFVNMKSVIWLKNILVLMTLTKVYVNFQLQLYISVVKYIVAQ